MEILTFADAIAKAGTGAKYLLLGNGFSIDFKPDIFSYNALFSKAKFPDGSKIPAVFETLGVQDFECAVSALENAAIIAPIYTAQADSEAMNKDANIIKEQLITIIAGNHPERPYNISEDEAGNCITFINNFIGSNGGVYTLNYDILLYWVLMNASERKLLAFDDGFRNDQDDDNTPYVVWSNGEAHSQNVHYVHGALHLFDAGYQLRKYTWKRTDIALIDQARQAITDGAFPLFVSEGESQKKLNKIQHSGYLHKCYRSLAGIKKPLFTHGVSFSGNDEHIINLIERGKISNVFVGIHDNPDSESNKRTIRRALLMKENRHGADLSVHFYDTSSAHVWR